MQTSKIQYSPDELKLAENSEIILTKNRIVKKTIAVFASLADEFRSIAEQHRQQLPAEIFELSPKISRGEQYLELPYVMLDYPRVFSRDAVFAIRSFFWWGNYFSLTLHLKGAYKEMFGPRIKQRLDVLSNNNYWVNASEEEWAHNVAEEHYVLLKKPGGGDLEETIARGSFLKLVVKWPLQQGNAIEPLLKEQFSMLLQVISG
jgi:hypothetical protein